MDADGELRDIPRVPVERQQEPASAPVARRIILHRSYFDRFNFTEGCLKCRAIQRGDGTRSACAHSEACRRRIEGLMAQDEVLREHLSAAQARQDRYLAGEVERGNQAKPSAAAAPAEPDVPEVHEQQASSQAVVDDDDLIPEICSEMDPEEVRAAEIFGDFDEPAQSWKS